MKKTIALLIAFGSSITMASNANATAAEDSIDSLAQGCYSIQSPHDGKYMRRYQTSGTTNGGWSFDFKTSAQESAAKFFMKPSALKHFMLSDVDGRYLDTRFPADITSGTVTGDHSDWRIDSKLVGSEYHYRFTSYALNKWLRHNYSGNDIYFVDALNPFFYTSEEWFRLVPQTGCTPAAEVEVNINGDFTVLKSNVTTPIRGSIDPHTHITSYEFMGGTMVANYPVHRYGVTKALSDSSNIHGSWGSLDLIGNLMGFGDVNFRYDTAGWPNFPFWPHHKSMSHSGYYYKWIERAFKGGQRMMVSHVVENEVLCNLQSSILPQSWGGTNSCNTMDSVDLQIQRLHEIEDYIDAQEGGPGKGFFRLVTSSAQARQVVANGQMAVIIAIEASETFNCGLKDATCSQAHIDAQLQKYYDKGVRAIFPIHRFDNQFGGARIENGLINAGNNIATDYYFSTEACDDATQGQMMQNDLGLMGLETLLGISGNPEYDETVDQCNKRGLSELGVYLTNRMIDMKMIIEVDHMSQKTHEAVLKIAEERNYSGIVSGHSHMHGGAAGAVHENSKRVARLGGIIAPYNWDAHSISNSISNYLDVVEETPYLAGVPFSTDMSGLGDQPGPRSDVTTNPLNYPFTTEFGLVVDQQKSGNRTFSLNTDGMAHYGMIADHIQDIKEQTPSRIYESVMNSAEAYVQMWERVEANNDKNYTNPLPAYVSIFNRGAGKCMDIPGDDNGVKNGAWVAYYSCQSLALDQKWLYNQDQGTIANKMADGIYCLDNNATPWNNGYPNLQVCNGGNNQKWNFANQRIKSAGSANHSLDAYNNGWVGFWDNHNGWNQQWEMRLEDGGNRWAEYRSVHSGKCLQIANANNGTRAYLAQCNGSDNQQWLWNPSAGTLKSKLNIDSCLDVASANFNNGTVMQIYQCNNGIAQQFERHADDSFRVKANNDYAIDASGDNVILYWRNGGNNQKWTPTLR